MAGVPGGVGFCVLDASLLGLRPGFFFVGGGAGAGSGFLSAGAGSGSAELGGLLLTGGGAGFSIEIS